MTGRDDARRWSLAAVAAVAILLIVLGMLLWVGTRLGQDVTIVTDAADRLAIGAPLYDDPAVAHFGPDEDHYYGPPALAAIIAPVRDVPAGVVAVGGLIVAYLLAAAAVLMILRASRFGPSGTGAEPAPAERSRHRSWLAAAVIGLSGCYVVLAGALLGNPSMLLLPLLAVAFAGLTTNRPWLGGLAIGTLAALRVYPLALLVPLAIAGRWREVAWAIAAMVAWTVVGVVYAGPETSVAYIDTALALLRIPSPESIITNISPAALADHAGLASELVRVIRLASIVAALAMVIGGGVVMRSREPGRLLAGLGIAAAGMTLASATIWEHYLTVVVVSVLALVVLTGRARWGLLSAALVSGQFGSGLALIWIPGIVAWWLWRHPAQEPATLSDADGRPVAFG